jgi:phage nucleotide-binding protein
MMMSTYGDYSMSILKNVVKPDQLVDKQGAKILVYGESGAGKTYTCSTAPGKVLIISMEAGLLSIRDKENVDAIEIKSYEELNQIYGELKSGEHNYDTVCLDSVSEMSEILLNHELSINKDARKAYGNVQIACTNVMRMFRDLPMHVIFVCKMSKENNDGVWFFQPKMIGTKLGQSIPYFFDEVLALRVIEQTDSEGQTIHTRWLQTAIGDGYVCKDRSGKLEDLEQPDLTTVIGKLGFSGAQQVVEAVNEG